MPSPNRLTDGPDDARQPRRSSRSPAATAPATSAPRPQSPAVTADAATRTARASRTTPAAGSNTTSSTRPATGTMRTATQAGASVEFDASAARAIAIVGRQGPTSGQAQGLRRRRLRLDDRPAPHRPSTRRVVLFSRSWSTPGHAHGEAGRGRARRAARASTSTRSPSSASATGGYEPAVGRHRVRRQQQRHVVAALDVGDPQVDRDLREERAVLVGDIELEPVVARPCSGRSRRSRTRPSPSVSAWVIRTGLPPPTSSR